MSVDEGIADGEEGVHIVKISKIKFLINVMLNLFQHLVSYLDPESSSG
jgi:hypothetical protein